MRIKYYLINSPEDWVVTFQESKEDAIVHFLQMLDSQGFNAKYTDIKDKVFPEDEIDFE